MNGAMIPFTSSKGRDQSDLYKRSGYSMMLIEYFKSRMAAYVRHALGNYTNVGYLLARHVPV